MQLMQWKKREIPRRKALDTQKEIIRETENTEQDRNHKKNAVLGH